MARQREVIETVTCDMCGTVTDAQTVRLGWGTDAWELDLCAKDFAKVEKTFDQLIAAGRPARRRGRDGGIAPSRPTPQEREERWAILEAKGFERHPGRLSSAEIEALRAAGALS